MCCRLTNCNHLKVSTLELALQVGQISRLAEGNLCLVAHIIVALVELGCDALIFHRVIEDRGPGRMVHSDQSACAIGTRERLH